MAILPRLVPMTGRILTAAAALALAAVPVVRQHALAERQEALAAWLASGGTPVPHELEHEPDIGRAELRAARAALGFELDPARRADVPAGAAAAGEGPAAARLGEAARLAAANLSLRPAAWEAAMVMGAATYLSWSQGHDTRLFTSARSWEEPLTAAIELAPGRSDAARLLAAVYLEVWPQLAPARREREKALLARVFADPQSFAGLLAPWLAAAGDREEAFSVVPANPETWERIAQLYAQQSDWPDFCAARERWDLVLRASLANRLAAAEERRGAPDARDRLLAIVAEARRGRAYLPLVARALESCPPGSVDHHTAMRLLPQLAWNLDRCRIDACPLAAPALARLAGFCRDLDPRLDAMAALVSGDLGRAFVLERTYSTTWSEEWAPYWLLKARTLVERGQGAAEAVASLAEMPHDWFDRPGYWEVRAVIARAAAEPDAEAAAARELARLAAREWPASAWDASGAVARLELLAGAAAPDLAVAIDAAPPRGAAVEVRLDQSILGTFPVAAGTALALHAPLAPGLHLLELESVAGGAVRPGAVRLTGSAAAGAGAAAAAGRG